MTAITHSISRPKKISIKEEKNRFDYKSFSKNLRKYKEKNQFTYIDISLSTGIGMSLIVQIINDNYKSDLSMKYACKLAEWMSDDICNYLK